MRFSSGRALREQPAHAVTFFGMSGVGKTTLAGLLQRHDWFQYSVDYRIGTRYMDEHIVDNFKREAMKVPFLRQLLRSDSIYIRSNLSFENLSPLSTYLGKPGREDRGGIPFAEYVRRQAQHRQAEVRALLDVPEFIERAKDIYGYSHFVCDSGGSLCEIVDVADTSDPVLQCLSQHTMLVYIRGTADHTRMLVERFRAHPKPMYYNPRFLDAKWAEYKSLRGVDDAAVDPDDFAVWGFEQLLAHRLPLYEAIAERYGYVIEMDEVPGVRNEADVLDLLERAIDRDIQKKGGAA
ncbi:MAG: ATPase [Gemmatimonadaceae bacterium]|nr:ATPase [Gemmatimonadaceae bacterium]